MLLSPLWEYRRGLRTIYAITDRRILILDGVVRDSVRSYEAAEIAAVQVRGRRGGPGSIVFRRHDVASGERPYAEPAAFRALVDTAEAARHLAALRRRHPPATPSHERDQA